MQQYQFEIKEPERNTLNKLIDLLCHHKSSFPFHKPVDYVQLGLLDYPIVVQRPMDLQTVREKLREHQYVYVADCLQDLLLIWENCRKYNQPTNQMIVKMANDMEAYQLRITKNYLPPQKALHKKVKRPTDTDVKIEEKSKEEVNIEPFKIQERVEKIEQPSPVLEMIEKIQEKVEANIATNIDCSAHLENLAVQAQNSLQKINELMRSVVPQVLSSIESQSKWDMIGHQIRQHFLDLLKECNDCEVTLIFMMMKRRCPRCLDFDREGNSTINLSRIDDYTIALATSQIKVWKNKHASGLAQ